MSKFSYIYLKTSKKNQNYILLTLSRLKVFYSIYLLWTLTEIFKSKGKRVSSKIFWGITHALYWWQKLSLTSAKAEETPAAGVSVWPLEKCCESHCECKCLDFLLSREAVTNLLTSNHADIIPYQVFLYKSAKCCLLFFSALRFWGFSSKWDFIFKFHFKVPVVS